MFLNLSVGKLEDLQAIWESGLCSLSFTEEVDDLLIRVCLLDVSVVKVYDSISIREGFTSNLIAENNFFLVINKYSLYLTVISDNFTLHIDIWRVIIVILIRVL